MLRGPDLREKPFSFKQCPVPLWHLSGRRDLQRTGYDFTIKHTPLSQYCHYHRVTVHLTTPIIPVTSSTSQAHRKEQEA